MSAAQFREYRGDVSGRAVERFESWANEHSTLIGIGIGMLVGGVAAIAFLGPLGAAVVGGALLSGGMSVFTSKNSDGAVNWGKVGLDTLLGGLAGGAGGFSGGIQNEYSYLSVEGDHSVLGGTATGALSPVVKTGNRPVEFVFDRVKDYSSGVINYVSRTSPGDWSLDDLNKKGIIPVTKGTLKGIGKEINRSIR